MARASTKAPPSADEPTVKLAEKRFVRRQRARRWLAWRRILVLVVLLGLIAGLGWLVFFSSALAVKRVTVAGLDVLGPEEVRRAAAVPVGEPLATAPVDAIAARVESLTPVASVDVSRVWPDAVRIAVVEREAVAVVEREGTMHGLDEAGVLFRTYDKPPKRLPVVRVAAATRSEALQEAAEVVAALPGKLAARVDFLTVRTVDSISLRLEDGRTVFWGSAAGSADKAEVLDALLKQDASFYDVSVPGRPTIRR